MRSSRSNQVPGWVHLKIAGATVAHDSGRILHHEKPVALNGGVEWSAGGLNRALREILRRSGTRSQSNRIRTGAETQGLRYQVRKRDGAGFEARSIQVCQVVTYDVHAEFGGGKSGQSG